MVYTNDITKEKLERKEKTKRILKIVYTPIIILVILGCFSILYQKLIAKEPYVSIFGYQSFIVLTGSMEPEIKPGDIVVIKEVNGQNLQVGDIITYSIKNTTQTVTHRIIEVVNKDGSIYYKTKGDNNNAADSELIESQKVVGKLALKFDQLGTVFSGFATTGGIAFIVLIVLASWSYTSKRNDRRLAREEARKKYNVCKYKKYEGNVDDTV